MEENFVTTRLCPKTSIMYANIENSENCMDSGDQAVAKYLYSYMRQRPSVSFRFDDAVAWACEPVRTDIMKTYFSSSLHADSDEFIGFPAMNIDTWLKHFLSPDILLCIKCWFVFMFLPFVSQQITAVNTFIYPLPWLLLAYNTKLPLL